MFSWRLCTELGSEAWNELSGWLSRNDFLSESDKNLCFRMSTLLRRGADRSSHLNKSCMKVWKDAESRGWQTPVVSKKTATKVKKEKALAKAKARSGR